jgi:hypothetical protein
MMMSWTNRKHAAKRPGYSGTGACLRVRLSSSPVNIFSGKLGQETSIDSRNIRH